MKAVARARKIGVNKPIDELATIALANHDARLRFEIRARRGNAKRGLEVLDSLGDA